MRLETQTFFDDRDLDVCQKAFDNVCHKAEISRKSEQAGRIAGMIIELYGQGVHSPEHLSMMVEAARGLFNK
jgi:hypothetical protein